MNKILNKVSSNFIAILSTTILMIVADYIGVPFIVDKVICNISKCQYIVGINFEAIMFLLIGWIFNLIIFYAWVYPLLHKIIKQSFGKYLYDQNLENSSIKPLFIFFGLILGLFMSYVLYFIEEKILVYSGYYDIYDLSNKTIVNFVLIIRQMIDLGIMVFSVVFWIKIINNFKVKFSLVS